MPEVLADLVLLLHLGIAGFIGGGFVLIPLGAVLGWRWVRRRRLRQLHAGAILFVALEALLGLACPLTLWEAALRGGRADESGFIGRLLYWDLPPAFFTALYVALALFAFGLWRWVPPQRQ